MFMHLGYHVFALSTQSPNVDAARPFALRHGARALLLTFGLNLAAILSQPSAAREGGMPEHEAESPNTPRSDATQARPRATREPAPKMDATVNVVVRYGDKAAINERLAPIAENQVTALIGPSGCGKSTFLRSLNRMNDLVDGCRVRAASRSTARTSTRRNVDPVEVRRRVGMVFQKSNPFPKSIFENVAFGLRIAGEQRPAVIARRWRSRSRAPRSGTR
jgi:ABC-type multidrug transport system fused ATPase/permease subunit